MASPIGLGVDSGSHLIDPDSPSGAHAAEGLSRELARVVQRLRTMALDAVPVDQVHAAGQALADLAADATGGPPRVVPTLAPYAAADQIQVLTDEVRRSADALEPARALTLVEAARALLVDLRRTL